MLATILIMPTIANANLFSKNEIRASETLDVKEYEKVLTTIGQIIDTASKTISDSKKPMQTLIEKLSICCLAFKIYIGEDNKKKALQYVMQAANLLDEEINKQQ